MEEKKVILVTGATGMIGLQLVKTLLDNGIETIGIDIRDSQFAMDGYRHYVFDLSDVEAIRQVFSEHKIVRVIHLAALAHTVGGRKVSYKDYFHANVVCARNIFMVAAENNASVLFISTADVYGFVDGEATVNSTLFPVSAYGKTKMLAEEEVKKICAQSGYTIFRFAPVYTDEIQRDIRKRYYLRYPSICYIVGNGTDYEVLSVEKAIAEMFRWIAEPVRNMIENIKNVELMNTVSKIEEEKELGRAKYVFHFPRWFVNMAFAILKTVTGKNEWTYLLNKVVNPIRTE